MADLYLGLDLGTSGCKLIAFDGSGTQIARAARPYAVTNPGAGLFELDAEQVWSEAEACFREIDARALPGRVAALCLSVQGEAFVPVDRDGRVLAPSPVSVDMRGTAAADALVERLGAERIYAITGQPPSPLPSLPKMMWFRTARPELFAATWKFLCFGEFALLRLGLPPVIDAGMASRTMAFDIAAGTWSHELLDAAELPVEKLAPVAASGTIVGALSARIAADLHVPEGVPVVLGGHDQPMGALGAGILAPGSALYAMGTTEALVAVLAERSPALGDRNIPCYPHVVPGRYVALAGTQSGGRVLAWYREAMSFDAEGVADPDSLDRLFSSLTDEPPAWPILLPHFAGSGSVLNDPASVGALFGLRFETSRAEILHAFLEGIAFEQALNLKALSDASSPVGELRAAGGGTRSSVWLQMKADIVDRPITRVSVSDASCLGAAILGRWAIEGRSPIEDLAGAMVTTAESYRPRPERTAAHARRFQLYRQLYAALRPLALRFRDLA
jgi:xylulokinase